MAERERALVDAHRVGPEEYREIPELTDEWFEKAEFSIDGKVVRPAKRPGRRKSMLPRS
jgi:hypothetical protein